MHTLKSKAGRDVVLEARPVEEAFREGMEEVDALLGCLEHVPHAALPWDRDALHTLDFQT